MAHNDSPGRKRRKERRAAARAIIFTASESNVSDSSQLTKSSDAISVTCKAENRLCPKPDQEGTTQSTMNDSEDKIELRKSKGVWLDVAGILGGIVFAHYSQAFFSTGHPLAGVWCTFGGTIMAFLIIAHLISKAKPKWKHAARTVCGLLSLVAVVCFVVWSIVLSRPQPPEPSQADTYKAVTNLSADIRAFASPPAHTPHLKLIIEDVNSKKSRLELTNNSIFVTDRKSVV